jgi:GNAT superfamily N-acetyltransferase
MMTIEIGLLIDHKEAIEPLAALFESEWADWYNPRGASAHADLSERMRRDGLPLGIVALEDGMVLGACALTVSSGGLVTDRSPWVGGLLVMPQARRRGVAKALLGRARAEARRLGYRRLYALTADAVHLFEQQKWTSADVILMSGKPYRVFAINT